jgi:hypothetical protein
MKNTSFERIWTKTSVTRILKEYLRSTSGFPYICLRSREFKSIWENPKHRERIAKLSFEFSGIRAKMIPDSLFHEYGLDFQEAIQLRTEFLKHEIKRLSAK